MGTTLRAPHPWPHITAALRGPGPRRVAIAYLDTTAPELLSLRAGDLLIREPGSGTEAVCDE